MWPMGANEAQGNRRRAETRARVAREDGPVVAQQQRQPWGVDLCRRQLQPRGLRMQQYQRTVEQAELEAVVGAAVVAEAK